jgi:tripartite-type tricarboxylate transporter receptor subunit TctC
MVKSRAIFMVAMVWAQQDYPDKPIRLPVGSAAGGTTDLVARAVSQRMGKILGQMPAIHPPKKGSL